MRLLQRTRIATRPARPRVFVLGLDGTPCSYLRAETAAGRLPNLAALFREGGPVPMRSSLPSVSSTAWTTFCTGRDPGGHGVFGFTDLRPDSHDLFFPNSGDVAAPAIWDLLARTGRRSVALNIPGTYPARPVQGALVAGFVAPSIERAVHPPALLPRLRTLGYRIDLDTRAARESFEWLEEDLFATLDRRVAALRMLLTDVDWDLFVAVFTETDRLYHFLWNAMEAGEPRVVDLFHRFHHELDRLVGWLMNALPAGTHLVSLSDHGFAAERAAVYVNAWLRERGYLAFEVDRPVGLSTISPASTVFSLDPGRLYVNRAGRRPRGGVGPDQVPAVLERLLADLADLRDPSTGELAYTAAVVREDAYHGARAPLGPDVILTLKPGYDLKASVKAGQVFGQPEQGLGGMHADDDAYLYVGGAAMREGPHGLEDLAPTIADLLGVELDGLQGRSVLAASPAGTPA
jgi:predicted AlkP superfamily phosphohydrolase/phosphomutase